MTESTTPRVPQQSKQTRSFMSPTTANGIGITKEDVSQKQSAWSKPLPPPVPKVTSPTQKPPISNVPSHFQRQLHFGAIPATTLDLSLPPRTQSAPPNLDELNNPTAALTKQPHQNQSSEMVPIPTNPIPETKGSIMSSSVGHKPDVLMNINPNRKYSVPFLDQTQPSDPQPPKERPTEQPPQSAPTSKLTHQAPSFYPKSGPYLPNVMAAPPYYPPQMMPMMPMYPYPPPPPQFGMYTPPVTTPSTQPSSSFIIPPKKVSKAITIKDPTTGEPIKLNEVPIFNKPPTSPNISEPTPPAPKPLPIQEQTVDSIIDQIKELKIEPIPSILILPEDKESTEDESMSVTTLEEGEIRASTQHIKYPSNNTYSKELLLSFQSYEFIPYDSPDSPPFIPDSITELLEQGSPNYYYSSGANRYMARRTSYRTDKPMHRRSSSPRSSRRSTTKRSSKTPDSSTDMLLPVSLNRWIRPGLISSSNMEKIFRFMKGSLNKLTAENFDRITRKVIETLIPAVQILTDSYQRLESQLKDEPVEDVSQERADMEAEATSIMSGIIQIIFDKAVDEPNFSPLYAMTCTRIVQSTELPVVPMKLSSTGTIQPISLFKRLLLSKCQEEFEKKVAWTKEKMEKQDDATPVDGLNAGELEYQRLKLKRRTLGNISFIGHLYMQGLLREQIIHNCIRDLLSTTEEEEIECCCKMLTTSGSMLDTVQAKKVMNAYFKRLQELASDTKMSSRLKFMIMDLMDLREAGWDKKKATELGKQSMTGEVERKLEPPPGLDHPSRYSDHRSSSTISLRSNRSSSAGLSDRQGYNNRPRSRPSSRKVVRKEDTFQPVTKGKRVSPIEAPQNASQPAFRSSNAFDALVGHDEKESNNIDNSDVMSVIQSIILESPSKADMEDMTNELVDIANDSKNSVTHDWIIFKFFLFVLEKGVREVERAGKYIGGYYLKELDESRVDTLATGTKRLFDVYDDWKEDIPKIDHIIGLLLGTVLLNSEEWFVKECLDGSLPRIIPDVKAKSSVIKEMIKCMNDGGFKLPDEYTKYLTD